MFRLSRRFGARGSGGFALVVVLVVLGLLSIFGLYLGLTASAELRISDNGEGQIRAHYAAMSGIAHARAALRGLDLDDQLTGPDGVAGVPAADWRRARSHGFRNPLDTLLAVSLDLRDPSAQLSGLVDDGVLNPGCRGAAPCAAMVPGTGLPLTVAGSDGAPVAVARYFVKVTDNNGDPSETAADPADNPYVDGDGTVLVRSLGLAQVIREALESGARRNSTVLWEARLSRRRTFRLDAALVLQGTEVRPAGASLFVGNSFRLDGGDGSAGLGMIDPDLTDGIDPLGQVAEAVAADQRGNIVGAGVAAPSLADLSGAIAADPDKSLLLRPEELWDLTRRQLRGAADQIRSGAQEWNGASGPDLGRYDPTLPSAAPGQDPRFTFVDGDLSVSGTSSGAGLLVVTGCLTVAGDFSFYGLIVVAGAGQLVAEAAAGGVDGGLYLAALDRSAGVARWAPVRLSVGRQSRVTMNRDAIKMAISLIPPSQVGLREILSTLDP